MILPDSSNERVDWRGLLLRSVVVIVLSGLVWGALWMVFAFSQRFPSTLILQEETQTWLVISGIMAVGQVLLLVGAPRWTRGKPRRKRAMIWSVLVFGAIGAGLMMGVIGTTVGLVYVVWDARLPSLPGIDSGIITLIPLVLWLVWTILFWKLTKGDWAGRFGRIYRLLVKGTVLELAMTVPVDVLVRRKTDCYCGEGTAVALACGILSAGFLFGPGVVLLMLRRRVQWMRSDVECFGCGYDLRGLTECRCPECGRPFVRTGVKA